MLFQQIRRSGRACNAHLGMVCVIMRDGDMHFLRSWPKFHSSIRKQCALEDL